MITKSCIEFCFSFRFVFEIIPKTSQASDFHSSTRSTHDFGHSHRYCRSEHIIVGREKKKERRVALNPRWPPRPSCDRINVTNVAKPRAATRTCRDADKRAQHTWKDALNCFSGKVHCTKNSQIIEGLGTGHK